MNLNIRNINTEKLLRVQVHNKLNFNEHLDGMIKKASRKVGTFSWIFPFMDLKKEMF